MARYGNTSVSSLLSAARSSASSYQTLQDQEQEFNWTYGPQDSAAFKTYNDYLQNRVAALKDSVNPADQEKAITYTSKAIQAQRTFNTNQVQNMSIQILQGNASNQDKLNLLGDQLRQAVASGADPQTIQGLQSLYDHQAITVTNEQTAAATKASSNYSSSVSDYVKALKSQNSDDPNQAGTQQLQNMLNSGKISVNEYAKQMSNRLQSLQAVYSNAQDDPNLSDSTRATYSSDLENLQKSSDFSELASPQAIQAFSNGENLNFAKVRTDDGRGWTVKTLNPTGQTVALDKNGQPFIKSTYELNSQNAAKNVPGDITKQGYSSFNVQKNLGPEQERIFKDSQGSYYYIDPDTAKKVFFDPTTGVRALADPNNPNVDTTKAAAAGGHSALGEYGTSLGAGFGDLGHEIVGASSAVGHGIAGLLNGGVGKLLNPVEAALNQPNHPSQVATTFNNIVSTVQRALTGSSAPAQPKMPLAPMPINNAPYAKSVLYSAPTPYPSNPTPAQQNTNTVAAINKSVGFTPPQL